MYDGRLLRLGCRQHLTARRLAPLGCRACYASSDIFFLEACFYSMMCSNRDQLFWVEPGADWECNLDRRGFERMRDMILRPKK